MATLPTLKSLAAASEQDVLRLWEGLGYYGRARRLRQAARLVNRDFGGRLPEDAQALQRLPGIGRYTAAAIASIAFGADRVALDGNVRRVLSRLFDIAVPVDVPSGEKLLQMHAETHLPHGRAGAFNQALMDLGALVCLPANPRCDLCPLASLCISRNRQTTRFRPVKGKRAPIPEYVHAAAVIARRGRVLLARRPANGLLGGLWEFPQGRVVGQPRAKITAMLRRNYALRTRRKARFGEFTHSYTHFRVFVHAFRCELMLMPRRPQLRWARVGELDAYPMGKVDRQIARLLAQA
jgi:A/G-specific adenine glycosylase